MKIVAYGQGSAGARVAARRWRAGREVTGRGRVGDDRGSREGSPAGRWWTLAAVCLGTFMLLLDISAVYVAQPSNPGGGRVGSVGVWHYTERQSLPECGGRRSPFHAVRPLERSQWSSSHQM